MMKKNKKGFTLIELLAVIVILAILVAVSIPAVTKYLTTARKGTYATNATTAIDAYRNYIVSNGITKSSSMTLAQLNGLLEKKLTTSSYGSAYESFSKIYVTFDSNLIPTYSICLVDAEGNGVFTGTGESLLEKNIKGDKVATNGNITACSLNTSLLTPTVEAAFTFSGGGIMSYNAGIGGTDVVIPSTIGGVDVIAIGAMAFKNIGITSVVIPDTVRIIDVNAFQNNLLTTVVIPDSVTRIDIAAFRENELTSVIIGTGVTQIGSNAFEKYSEGPFPVNSDLTSIINKTGRSFDWGTIINGISGYNFVTGTVVNAAGNVIVSN